MRNRKTADSLRILLARARYEVLPTPSCEAAVAEHVPPGFTVTSPRRRRRASTRPST